MPVYFPAFVYRIKPDLRIVNGSGNVIV